MPGLVKSDKTPPPPPPEGAIFWRKRVKELFENVSVRTPPDLGALNPKNLLLESKKLPLGTFWVKLYTGSWCQFW